MKTHFFTFALLGSLCGCTVFSPAPQDQDKGKKVVPPPAVEKKSPAAEVKKTAHQPVIAPAQPAPQIPKEQRSPQPPPPRPGTKGINHPENSRQNSIMWKVFARLSPQEQQEMIKLQRQDPEKFRQIMQQKVAKFNEMARARKKELDDLAQRYRASNNEAEKQAIKLELKKKLHEDFSRRLADSRRSLETNRKRLARMEAELQRREKNQDAIVDAMLKHRLSGEKMPPQRHR